MPTHVHARCGLNPDFISRGIYINRQPCAPSIRMSRVRIVISVTQLCRENWYRMKSCLLRNMIAQCLKFLQNMFGKIFEDLGANAIIIIIFPRYSIHPFSRAATSSTLIALFQIAAA